MRFPVLRSGLELSPRRWRTVESMVRRALGRFGHRLQDVRVHFTDTNGPRGGPDKKARVEVRIPGSPTLRAAAEHETRRGAVRSALRRLGLAMSRQFERRVDLRRRSSRFRPAFR